MNLKLILYTLLAWNEVGPHSSLLAAAFYVCLAGVELSYLSYKKRH